MEIFNTFIVVLISPRERFYNKELFINTDLLEDMKGSSSESRIFFFPGPIPATLFSNQKVQDLKGGGSRRSAISTNSWEIIFSFNFQY